MAACAAPACRNMAAAARTNDTKRAIFIGSSRMRLHYLNIGKSGVPGDPPQRGTPDPLLRWFWVRKSKRHIVRCMWAKVNQNPVFSSVTWATDAAVASAESNICLRRTVHGHLSPGATTRLPGSTTELPPRSKALRGDLRIWHLSTRRAAVPKGGSSELGLSARSYADKKTWRAKVKLLIQQEYTIRYDNLFDRVRHGIHWR